MHLSVNELLYDAKTEIKAQSYVEIKIVLLSKPVFQVFWYKITHKALGSHNSCYLKDAICFVWIRS